MIQMLLGLLIILGITSSPCLGASKLTIPPSNAQDLLGEIRKSVHHQNNTYIYLYPHPSIYSSQSQSTIFDLSMSPYAGFMWMVELFIFHDIDAYIQSEYLDFTIWGMLGNYFNKDIKQVTTEYEIHQLFEKIEEINQKYQMLIQSSVELYESERPPTLDKKAYLLQRYQNGVKHPSTERGWEDSVATGIESGTSHDHHMVTYQSYLDDTSFSSYKRDQMVSQSHLTRDNKQYAGSGNGKGHKSYTMDPESVKLYNKIIGMLRYMLKHKLETGAYLLVAIMSLVLLKSMISSISR